jgi:hypothetical protein
MVGGNEKGGNHCSEDKSAKHGFHNLESAAAENVQNSGMFPRFVTYRSVGTHCHLDSLIVERPSNALSFGIGGVRIFAWDSARRAR